MYENKVKRLSSYELIQKWLKDNFAERRGAMQSMDEIYQQYASMVYRYIFARIRNEDIAEEITQETFYQAIRCSEKFDGSCKVSTWLCAIAKNQLAAHLRKNPVHEDWEQIETTSTSAEDDYLAKDKHLTLLRQLHAIPVPYREVMYLRVFGELSFKEIGEIMEKSENWARVTFYRGKEKLRHKTLKKEES